MLPPSTPLTVSSMHKSALAASPQSPRTWSAVRDMVLSTPLPHANRAQFDADLRQRQADDLDKLEARQRRELNSLNAQFESDPHGAPMPPTPSSPPFATNPAAHYYPSVMSNVPVSPVQYYTLGGANGVSPVAQHPGLTVEEGSAVAAVGVVTQDVRDALHHEMTRAGACVSRVCGCECGCRSRSREGESPAEPA